MENPLKDYIKKRIRAEGPMNIANYMALCLSHPQYGYYMTCDPFGTKGDFTTAPEISQMFGELIGAWCLQVFYDLHEPERFHLIELGPGRGTLMVDALRIACKNDRFAKNVQIHLVETSPLLQEIQKSNLQDYQIQWHSSFDNIAIDAPLIVVANELFDALPIHQFIKHNDHWHERAIGITEDTDSLTFVETRPTFDPRLATLKQGAENGDILEICPAALNIIRSVTKAIKSQRGAGLFIDYGHSHTDFGDTLQAVKDHKYANILDDPGNADITAHVDFERLLKSIENSGISTTPIVTQRDFLKNLGIYIRADMLIKQNPNQHEDIKAALARLTDRDAMGTLFKVVGIHDPDLTLAGFENVYL